MEQERAQFIKVLDDRVQIIFVMAEHGAWADALVELTSLARSLECDCGEDCLALAAQRTMLHMASMVILGQSN